jgi:hypothetical protein
MAETLTFAGTDITSIGIIPLDGWAELLKGGPTRGDLIELDFTAGAVWAPGEPGTYSVVVPVVMPAADDPADLWSGAQTLIAMRGTSGELAYSTDAGSGTCDAVITGEVACNWGPRSMLTVILVFQILTPWEAGAGS